MFTMFKLFPSALANYHHSDLFQSQHFWGGGGRSGTVGGRSPDASLVFYLREALQYQTSTEKILYNKSR